jgi:site-specific recombinase XerD
MSKVTEPPSLARHVQMFFGDYLTLQRDMSPHTVLSYRDAFKLFLNFAARHHCKPITELSFEDVNSETVLAFLADLEHTRKACVRTRNSRLAAIRSFFRYVAAREPRVLEICQRVAGIPNKKLQSPSAVYLERDEVLHILDSIDRSTCIGRRDYLLIRLLFETGARAHEIAGLRTTSLRFGSSGHLRLLGKGRKERLCPLRAATAALVHDLLRDRGLTPEADNALFVGIRGTPLTRYGILRIVQRHVRRAAATMRSLNSKRIGAHTFRHSAAIHLLRSGNDLSVVRSWLGHVSVTTTDQYTEIDFETKRRALEATEPITSASPPSWKGNPDLLTWLEAL